MTYLSGNVALFYGNMYFLKYAILMVGFLTKYVFNKLAIVIFRKKWGLWFTSETFGIHPLC